jgi:hypothetical protein
MSDVVHRLLFMNIIIDECKKHGDKGQDMSQCASMGGTLTCRKCDTYSKMCPVMCGLCDRKYWWFGSMLCLIKIKTVEQGLSMDPLFQKIKLRIVTRYGCLQNYRKCILIKKEQHPHWLFQLLVMEKSVAMMGR